MATASPTPTPSISPCILQCVVLAASQNGCTGVTDITCLCTNGQFQADAVLCLTTHCTPADQAAVPALWASQCSPASLTPTGPASPTPKPVSFSSSAASATSTSAPVANTSSISIPATATSSTSSSSSTSGPTTSSPDTGTGGLDSATQLKIGLGVGLGVGLSGFFLLLFLSYKLYQRTKSGRVGNARHPEFDHK